MTTIRHFIPLIGPYVLASKKLGIKDEDDIYSFGAFGNNEQHVANNDPSKVINLLSHEAEAQADATSDLGAYIDYVKANNVKPTDLVTAVPPCAGLSMLNPCKESKNGAARGSDAVQNKWIYSAVKFYLATGSNTLVFENAPALAGPKGYPIIENIKKIIEDNDYSRKIQLVKTTTLNHGIPQHRSRSFLIIHQLDSFMKLRNKPHESITVEDFLRKFTIDSNDEAEFPLGSKSSWGQLWLQLFKDHPEIMKSTELKFKDTDVITYSMWESIYETMDKDPSFLDSYPFMKKNYDYNKEKLSRGLGYWDAAPSFIKGKVNAIISKNAVRVLNPIDRSNFITFRQMMDLMGMPHDFKLADPKKNWNHICQNIPVNTAADSLRWAQECVDTTSEYNEDYKLDIDDFDFIIQDNMKSDLENHIVGYKNGSIVTINTKKDKFVGFSFGKNK